MTFPPFKRSSKLIRLYVAGIMSLAVLSLLGLWFYTRMTAPEPQAASSKAEMPQFVRELGGIKEYRLSNGLQILLFADQAQSTTTVNITYRVGSRHEAPGEYGMAHLLEHMLFKDTPSHKNISEATAQRGMAMNANASTDRTIYHTSFNAKPETLAFALELEADRMFNSLINKEDLDKEMTVVRNEFEQDENDLVKHLYKQVQGVAYQWHNYGHSVLGPKSDIENMSTERLRAFYKRYYRPDNATLMVSGRFELQPTLALIAKLYGPLRTPATPIVQPYTVEPAQDGERSVVVKRIGGEPMLVAHYHVPAVTHPDTPALLLLGNLMSDESRGALYTHLVQDKLALSAQLSGIGGADPGSIVAIARLAPGTNFAKAEARFLDILEGRAGPALKEEDLQRIRELTQHLFRVELQNPEALMQKIMDYGPDWRILFLLMQEVDKVTLADLERVRRTYLRPANRTLGRYIPSNSVTRVDIPPAPPLQERLAHLQEPAKISAGEYFDPTPQNLAQRTQTKQLASGITLTTLAKQTRGQQVQLLMRLKWGERNATFRERGHSLLGNLVVQGTTNMSLAQLQDRIVALKAVMNIQSDNQGVTLRIQAEKNTLLQALAIAADVMRNPLLPQDDFDLLKRNMLSHLEGSRQSLDTLAMMAVRDHYNHARQLHHGHPDYIASVDEQIADIKATRLEDLRHFHRTYWSANQAQIAVVGDLPKELDSTLKHLFADWKKPQAPPYVPYITQAMQFKPARFEALASDKSGASMLMETNLALNDRDPDYLPLAAAAYIFGHGIESRLGVRIREQAGLSYNVGANLNAPHFGNAANFVISSTFAPQNREQMLKLVQEELQAMTRNGITEAELTRCKRDVLETRQQMRGNNEVLVSELLRHQEEGENWVKDGARDHEIAALTLAQVNAAWRKYINTNGFVVVTVGDFKP